MAGEQREHPKKIGDRSEAHALARLVDLFGDVWVPFSENSRFDFLVEWEDRFIRVQVKTGRLRAGSVRFPACSSTYHHPRNRGTGGHHQDYRGQADLFAVYCPENGDVYIVPVADVGMRLGVLRVLPPANNQLRRIRWAADHVVPGSNAKEAHLEEYRTRIMGWLHRSPGMDHATIEEALG